MKPHPRIRKTIKWGGAAVTVLLVVVWIGSGWFRFRLVYGPPCRVAITNGQVRFMVRSDHYHNDPFAESSPRLVATELNLHFPCLWYGRLSSLDENIVGLPLWPLPLGTLIATATAWHLDTLARRRARGGVNLCPKCNYDRGGLASGAGCPECGIGGTSA